MGSPRLNECDENALIGTIMRLAAEAGVEPNAADA
jgi:hypothetical protein